MDHENLTQLVGSMESTLQRVSSSQSAIAPHRGDVTTVQAAAYVRLKATKRIEKLQTHAPSHPTVGTTPMPALIPTAGRA